MFLAVQMNSNAFADGGLGGLFRVCVRLSHHRRTLNRRCSSAASKRARAVHLGRPRSRHALESLPVFDFLSFLTSFFQLDRLDSDYPLNKSTTGPGVARGPCARTSGTPSDVEANAASAKVIYVSPSTPSRENELLKQSFSFAVEYQGVLSSACQRRAFTDTFLAVRPDKFHVHLYVDIRHGEIAETECPAGSSCLARGITVYHSLCKSKEYCRPTYSRELGYFCSPVYGY